VFEILSIASCEPALPRFTLQARFDRFVPGEKPEGITAVGLAQWSAIGQNTVSNLLAEPVALVSVQLVNLRCFLEALLEAAPCRIGRKVLLGRIPQSPARMPSLSARKGGRCGGATYCREAIWDGENTFLGRNIFQQRTRTSGTEDN